MKITGQENFSFKALPIGSNLPSSQAYLYSGAISKPLLISPFTGYYDFVGNKRIRKKFGPDSQYTLVATGTMPSGIYETPHGISYSNSNYQTKAGKPGDYNFYMAFYGPGYYQPRVGELLTFGEVSYGLLRQKKIQIDDLNSSEALKVFGLRLVPRISPKIAPYIACKGAGALSRVHEGTHDCPLLAKAPYVLEALAADFSAGTYLGGIGGNPYSHNPLPSPYDRSVFIANSIYKSKFDDSGPVNADGEKVGECLYVEKNSKPVAVFDIRANTDSQGRPTMSNKQLFMGSRTLDGNSSVCSAGADGEDSSVAAYFEDGAGEYPPHSEPLNRDDQTSMPLVGVDLSVFSKSSYWHYVFKYNHYTLPFGNTSEAGSMVESKVNTAESEDHWWEYRECPENVDFLNHAFGNNITACPMNYLDVPYYASIGKFGYFGTRFQDTWRFINNEDLASELEVFSSSSASSDQQFYTSDKTDPSSPGAKVYFNIQLEWINSSGLPKTYKGEFQLAVGDSLGFNQMPDNSVELYVHPASGADYALIFLTDFANPSGPNSFADLKLNYVIPLRHVDYPLLDPEDLTKALDTKAQYSPRGAAYSAIPTDKEYGNLIRLSAIERNNYSFSISDQVVFLRLNYDVIKRSPEYLAIITGDPDFEYRFASFLFDFFEYNSSAPHFNNVPRGLSHAEKDSTLAIFSSSLGSDFETLVKKYGYVKVINNNADMRSSVDGGSIDVPWYNNLVNNKLARISNRYYVNIGLGKPVDLFPEGIITFSAEKASEFASNNYLKYRSVPSATQLRDPTTKLYQEIPNTELRYFHTALSTQSEVNLFEQNIYIPKRSIFFAGAPLSAEFNLTSQTKSFYLGYLNPRGCDKELPKGGYNYLTIVNVPNQGIWKDYAPESSPPPASNKASPPRVFAEEGRALDKNFSCFSPLFLQQPINTLTKSFLPATLRVFAVDYHTIPEDKILENSMQNGVGRPEIAYWLKKIKAIDSKGKNLYPLKYKWYRIANGNIPDYLKTKNEALLEPSSPTGAWYCFEGDNSPDCTVVTPSRCRNLAGGLASLPCSIDSLSVFAGPNIADANAYHYFCRVVGRFGWRDSELAKIVCESKIEMEFAFLNSAMTGGSSFSTPIGQVSFKDSGLQPDRHAVFEDVQEKFWNPGNDCVSWRHIGPEGMGGITRVWTPGTLTDSRGKTIRKSHWTPFGRLGFVEKSNEALCGEFYAKRALPYCDVGNGPTYKGVPMISTDIIHRTAVDTATFTSNSRVGLIAERITNIAELYPPPSMDSFSYGSVNSFPGHSPPFNQPAHFQFENHLGLIKRFSRNDTDGPDSVLGVDTIRKIGGQGDLPDLIKTVKNKIFNSGGGARVISGTECGYIEPSFGRFMHFYVETFYSFYSLCINGPKPKKVKNISHIAGGLRANHAGLQFNWLGRPKNARLKRESMPGPYGFQWKVERHNRDRRGNGMSLGFWSYFWEERMENMYDAAAVVGALKRLRPSPQKMSSAREIRRLRLAAEASYYGFTGVAMFRNVRFGPDLGPKLGCGSIRIKNEDPVFKPTKEVVIYSEVDSTSAIELKDFGCNGVNEEDCFLPCVSLKWPDGFSPKGKKMPGAAITSCYDCDERSPLIAIPPNGGTATKIWRKKISACSDGHRDACNYITPTIHLGIDSWLRGNTSTGSASIFGLLAS